MATPHSGSTLVRALQVTGALLFVVSLAMGGKAYFQALRRASRRPGTSPWGPLAIDVALFSAFALHHSVLARTRLKHWIHARVGVDTERALYVILASVLFLACTQLWVPLPGTWYALTGPWWWVGAAVQVGRRAGHAARGADAEPEGVDGPRSVTPGRAARRRAGPRDAWPLPGRASSDLLRLGAVRRPAPR